jgi:hypothetical protein
MDIQRRKALGAAAVLGLALSATAASAEEHHPRIRKALDALRYAREDLEHAAHDFGGHRVDAIRAIDDAISQLKLALQYDRN